MFKNLFPKYKYNDNYFRMTNWYNFDFCFGLQFLCYILGDLKFALSFLPVCRLFDFMSKEEEAMFEG